MKKSDMVEIVAKKAHLTKKASSEAIEVFLEEVKKALGRGEKVILSGFGTFKVTLVRDKEVVVPRTGERKVVKSHRSARFLVGRDLRRVVRS